MEPAAPTLTPPLTFKQFLIRGLFGCLLGTLIALLNLFVLVVLFPGVFQSNRQFNVPAVFALLGIIAGAIQGSFLRHTTRPALVWLLLSAFGWSLVGVVNTHDMIAWSSIGDRIASSLLIGALTALPQWLGLRRSLRFAACWPFLSASAWVILGLVIQWLIERFDQVMMRIIN
jgi:hypothetical protein